MNNLIDSQMTIDESIEILKCLVGDMESPYTNEQCKDKGFIEAKYDEAIRMAIKALERQSPAQPERKKGKWVKKMLVTETEKYISYDPEWYCDCCGTKYDPHIAKIVNFCYICGADMRGEQDETN